MTIREVSSLTEREIGFRDGEEYTRLDYYMEDVITRMYTAQHNFIMGRVPGFRKEMSDLEAIDYLKGEIKSLSSLARDTDNRAKEIRSRYPNRFPEGGDNFLKGKFDSFDEAYWEACIKVVNAEKKLKEAQAGAQR